MVSTPTGQPTRAQSKQIAVVGAGAAGVILASTIVRYARTPLEITIFESKSALGGVWKPSQGRGAPVPAYPFLRGNLPTVLTDSPLLPWSEFEAQFMNISSCGGSFPSLSEVASYIDALATKYLSRPANNHVVRWKFNTVVAAVSAAGMVTWRSARDDDDGEVTTRRFDHCIVCVGRFAIPRYIPSVKEWAQKGRVPVVHVADIDWTAVRARFTEGRVIVLVGAGSSARDLLCWLLRAEDGAAAHVHWVNDRIRTRYPGTLARHLGGDWAGRVSIHDALDGVPHGAEGGVGAAPTAALVILATGYDEQAHLGSTIDIGISSPEAACRPAIVHLFGREGTVAPLAMLYHEARAWVDSNLPSSARARSPDSGVDCDTGAYPPGEKPFTAYPPGEKPFTAYPPGEKPFTAYPAHHSDGITRFDPAFRQRLFEAAEARLVADFTTYRDVEWAVEGATPCS